jgi:hypothetical protein
MRLSALRVLGEILVSMIAHIPRSLNHRYDYVASRTPRTSVCRVDGRVMNIEALLGDCQLRM